MSTSGLPAPAVRSNWDIKAFEPVEDVPYEARFSLEEYDLIARGLVPEVMEDKWFIFLENDSLFFFRSWTGDGVFRVDFDVDETSATVRGAKSTPGGFMGGPGYNARILSFLVDNLLLGRNTEFPRPKGVGEPAPGVLQHQIAGTGFKEREID